MTAAVRGLTRNRAATAPDAADLRLRGRTYSIPFEEVWQAALRLAGRKRGWQVLGSDDLEGVIRVEARTLLRFTHDVVVQVKLDENAQTRVDLISASRVGKADFGKNARRIAGFLRALDRELERGARARRQARDGVTPQTARRQA